MRFNQLKQQVFQVEVKISNNRKLVINKMQKKNILSSKETEMANELESQRLSSKESKETINYPSHVLDTPNKRAV
jgi:uncharacterized FlgJ-related protein